MNQQDKENVLLKIIRNELETFPIFSGYSTQRQEIQKIKSPVVATFYDTTLESKIADRWLFVRVEDFYKYQKVIIWVNFLNNRRSVNFDIERYLVEHLQIKNINQELVFKSKTDDGFKEMFKGVLEFISENIDEKVRLLLSGQFWLDMPFDWQGYK